MRDRAEMDNALSNDDEATFARARRDFCTELAAELGLSLD
jgi:hypothetical protein